MICVDTASDSRSKSKQLLFLLGNLHRVLSPGPFLAKVTSPGYCETSLLQGRCIQKGLVLLLPGELWSRSLRARFAKPAARLSCNAWPGKGPFTETLTALSGLPSPPADAASGVPKQGPESAFPGPACSFYF